MNSRINNVAIKNTPIMIQMYQPMFKLTVMIPMAKIKATGAAKRLGTTPIKLMKASISKKFILAMRDVSAMKLNT